MIKVLSTQKNIYLYATIVTVLMGHNMLLIKSLLSTVDPLVLTFLRMFLTALTLAIVCYFMYGFVRPTKEEWKLLLLIGFLGVFIHQITLAYGLELSHVTNGSLIMGLNPLTTTLLGALLLKESLYPRHYVGVVLSFIGVCFIVFRGFSSISFSPGDIILFISMGSQALAFIYTRKLSSRMPVIPITAYMYIIGTVMLLIIPVSQDMSSVITFSAFTWLQIVIASVFLTGLVFLGFNLCIQRLGAGGASIFLNVVTVTAMFGAVVYLGETLLLQHIFGFIFISVGILVATHQKKSSNTAKTRNAS